MKLITLVKLIICLGLFILAGSTVMVFFDCIRKRSWTPYYKNYDSTLSLAISIVMLTLVPFEYYYTSLRSSFEFWDTLLRTLAFLLAAHGVIGYFISIRHTKDDQ